MNKVSKKVLASMIITIIALMVVIIILSVKILFNSDNSDELIPSITVMDRSCELKDDTMKFDLVLSNSIKDITGVDVMFNLNYIKDSITEKRVDFDEDEELIRVHVELEANNVAEVYDCITNNTVMTFIISTKSKESVNVGVSFKGVD